MRFGLGRSEQERAAEHDAAMLRAHYGAEAEAFCALAMSGPVRPNANRALRLISKKLKATPAQADAFGR